MLSAKIAQMWKCASKEHVTMAIQAHPSQWLLELYTYLFVELRKVRLGSILDRHGGVGMEVRR